MIVQRVPSLPLRLFVKTLWAVDDATPATLPTSGRERVLPTGEMHLAFRLSNHPVRLFDCVDGMEGRVIGPAVFGGARAGFYLRDTPRPARSVGAQLSPGAAQVLFGYDADVFAGRHASLEDLWGRAAAHAQERLMEARRPAEQLGVLESILTERLPRLRGLHPAVAQALASFETTADVSDTVRRSGYSHRHFIQLFRQAVGLPPKVYCRLLRFGRVIDRIKTAVPVSWAGLALAAGFSDQPHFNREFRGFAGVTPDQYRALAPRQFHVPVPTSSQESF
jgi:AraC-like DNA-binding protein